MKTVVGAGIRRSPTEGRPLDVPRDRPEVARTWPIDPHEADRVLDLDHLVAHAFHPTPSSRDGMGLRLNEVCRSVPEGNRISGISAPKYVDSRCRPGRCMIPNALLPANSASAKAALPWPMAERTTRPVTTVSPSIQLAHEQVGQLADVGG